MEFSQPNDDNLSLTRFESMLKTNNVLFFDSEEFENIIFHYLESGKIPLAKKAIKMGLEQHPSSTNLCLFQTEMFIIDNKFDAAEQLLDQLYDIEPNNEEIYIQKANLLSKSDQHEKAVGSLLTALDMVTEEEGIAELYVLIAMEYLFLEQFENAKHYFQKCLDINNEDYSALYNIIYCYDYLGEGEEAISFLNSYLDGNPYCEIAWHQQGIQYYAIKDYDKALGAFDFAIISDDTFVGAYLEKGKVLEKKKQYNDAIENYKITLALEEPTSFALLRIGYCQEKLGNDDLAVQSFYRTVHEDPLLDKGWIAITKFYNRKKNYQKALFYINKAINIDGENVAYWKLYAQINHRLNFIEEAEHGYKRTIELGNYELSTWLARADLLIALGEYDACVLNLIQTAEYYPEIAEIEFRLAGLHFVLHESSKGHYHLKNALLLNPDFKYILEELFPIVLQKPSVQQVISKSENSTI